MKRVYVGRVPLPVAKKLAELLAEEAIKEAMYGDIEDSKDIMEEAMYVERECQMAELEEEMEKAWEVYER